MAKIINHPPNKNWDNNYDGIYRKDKPEEGVKEFPEKLDDFEKKSKENNLMIGGK